MTTGAGRRQGASIVERHPHDREISLEIEKRDIMDLGFRRPLVESRVNLCGGHRDIQPFRRSGRSCEHAYLARIIDAHDTVRRRGNPPRSDDDSRAAASRDPKLDCRCENFRRWVVNAGGDWARIGLGHKEREDANHYADDERLGPRREADTRRRRAPSTGCIQSHSGRVKSQHKAFA